MTCGVGEVCETTPKETLCSAASEVRSGRSSQSCDPAAQCVGKNGWRILLWVNTASHAKTTHAWVSLRICWSVLLFFDLLRSCWNLRYQSDQARSEDKIFLKKREQRSCSSEQPQKKCPGWSNLAAATKPEKKKIQKNNESPRGSSMFWGLSGSFESRSTNFWTAVCDGPLWRLA